MGSRMWTIARRIAVELAGLNPTKRFGDLPHERGKPDADRRSPAAPHHQGDSIGVYDLSSGLPEFSYEPQPDGDADPGEVVWTWVPYEEDPQQGKDRPVLVVARHKGMLVVAQLTSQDHDRDAEQEARWGRYWLDIGSGDWDRSRRPSEVRLDRLLWVKPHAIRREGGTLPRNVFATVVQAIKDLHQ
ncbi:MAG: type II toxin-antitoxin system PemK/MazF family toxin [Bowdeniella nasicola]|nr:type II toxin-antitoxin system PemK/MazF family toxin [Bowdeniella nasicola]